MVGAPPRRLLGYWVAGVGRPVWKAWSRQSRQWLASQEYMIHGSVAIACLGHLRWCTGCRSAEADPSDARPAATGCCQYLSAREWTTVMEGRAVDLNRWGWAEQVVDGGHQSPKGAMVEVRRGGTSGPTASDATPIRIEAGKTPRTRASGGWAVVPVSRIFRRKTQDRKMVQGEYGCSLDILRHASMAFEGVV